MMDAIARFSQAAATRLGSAGWIDAPAEMKPYARDWLDRYGAEPLGVARPASTEEVSDVVKLCAEYGITITPQGGNTGLNGGAVLGAGQSGIVLSLARMNRLLAVDPIGFTATVEAGIVLAVLHERLTRDGLAFPLHLGAEGSAQIGGLIATNAGGSHAFRFGMMSDLVLGLEVVLADGSVWDGTRALVKDNAGYQLRRLFAGAEGTLGIVSKAVLRLQPAATGRATTLLALDGMVEALEVGARLRRAAGEVLVAMEFFPDLGLELALRHVDGLHHPFEQPHPLYLLVELASSTSFIDLDGLLEAVLGESLEAGLISDALVATSETQRAFFWKLREEIPEGQKREGLQIKHDISVPVSALPDFLRDAAAAAEAVLPGVRINPFGHLGDGNVHFNLSPPVAATSFSGREAALSEAVYACVLRHHGSIAAEHGLGQAKVALADRLRPPLERDLLRCIKGAFDPQNRLNPGKLIDLKQKAHDSP